MGGLLQASTERLQETAIPGPAPWTWRAGPAEPRCSFTEASVGTMRFGVGVAASAVEIVEVACEARRGRFSARGRSPGAKLEIGVKGACVGDLPASPAATAAAAVQLCPQEESSVEEALFSLCVGGLSPRGRAVGHLNVRRGLTPPGPTALLSWSTSSDATIGAFTQPRPPRLRLGQRGFALDRRDFGLDTLDNPLDNAPDPCWPQPQI